jgi:methyl-accepting chemotaxis protein
VQRVTEIIGSIAHASREQTGGIERVNDALAHMEQDTQQNAALVEETAASAHALQEQAANLAQLVSVFTLAAATRPTPSAAAARARLGAPVPRSA